MRLMYCGDRGVAAAREFGLQQWGPPLELENPVSFRSSVHYNGVPAENLPLEEFIGEIAAVDDEGETIYVEILDGNGKNREFGVEGEASLYIPGRKIAVRYREVSRYPSGFQVIDILEIWLDV